LVLNGELHTGLDRSEGGHIVIKTTDGWQSWESLASGRSIMRRFGKKAADITDPDTLHAIANDLALGFQAIIPTLQPDLIIIGGSVGTYFERYGHLLQEILRRRLHDVVDVPPIKKATHPEEAVLYGCYHYARTYLPSKTTA
jgi:glucokinase